MTRANTIIWRSQVENKQLLTLEESKICVTAYELTPPMLLELSQAIGEALDILADRKLINTAGLQITC